MNRHRMCQKDSIRVLEGSIRVWGKVSVRLQGLAGVDIGWEEVSLRLFFGV